MALEFLGDGSVTVCVQDKLNVREEGKSLVVEGQMLPSGRAKNNSIILVKSAKDANKLFGAGSVIAESIKVAFCQAPSGVAIYGLPRLDDRNGIAAQYELVIKGQALNSGILSVFAGNKKYEVQIPVEEGEGPREISKRLVKEYSEDFPFYVEYLEELEKIVFIAKNAGTVGNVLNKTIKYYDKEPIVEGITCEFTHTVEGENDPVFDDYLEVFGECCHYAYALNSPNPEWQKNLIAFLGSRWDCSRPMCGGHGYTYNTGTVGQILSTFTNAHVISKMAINKNDSVFPYLKNTAYAALSVYTALTDVSTAVEGPERGLLDCIQAPITCGSTWSFEEITLLQNSDHKFVIAESTVAGYGGYSSPHVFRDITNYSYDRLGRLNETYAYVPYKRIYQKTIEELAEFLSQFVGAALFGRNTIIPEGKQGLTLNMVRAEIKAWAENRVGVLFSGPIKSEDIEVNRDVDVAPPCMGIPGRLIIKFTFRPPSSVTELKAFIAPKILDDCRG